LACGNKKDFDQNFFFEFRKNGLIKVDIDTDDDWNLNRRKMDKSEKMAFKG